MIKVVMISKLPLRLIMMMCMAIMRIMTTTVTAAGGGTHLASLAGEGSEVEAGSWLPAHFAQLIHSAEGREEIHYYWVVTTTSCCRKLTVKSLGEIDVNRAQLRRGSCRGDVSVMSSGDVFRQFRSPAKTSGSLLNNTEFYVAWGFVSALVFMSLIKWLGNFRYNINTFQGNNTFII